MEKIGEIIFTIAIILELIVMMTDHFASWTIPFRGRITHVAFALFCIKILLTKYEKREWIIIIVICLIGAISYFTCKDEYIIRCIVFVVSAKRIRSEYILQLVLSITVIGTILIIVFSAFGIAGNVFEIRDYGRGIVEKRYCLGFNHANNVHDIYWYIVTTYFLVRKEKINWCDLIILTIVNIVLYQLTISRTGFLVVQSVIISNTLTRYFDKFNKRWFWETVGTILLVIIVYLTILGSMRNIGNNSIIATLDGPLNGRLQMLSENVNIITWRLFPESRSVSNVDNGLATVIFTYGIVIGGGVILLIQNMIILLSKEKQWRYVIAVLSCLLVFFMESTFIINVSILCNMFLLIFVCGLNDIKFFTDSSMSK